MNVLGVSLALVVSMLAVVGVGAPAGAVPSPDLVISQVYGGGGNAGAPLNADFVELFNRGTAPAALDGMSVQYASATGTGNFGASSSQLIALPAVDVPAGGRFLIGMTPPGANGVALPAPDATGTIAMAGTAGKVALATGGTSLGCNGSSTLCSAEQLARIVDLVGYGNANFAEGTPAPTLSATTSAQRTSSCVDTDSNVADFAAVAPAPGNSASPVAPCGAPPVNTPPSVTTDPFPIQHPAGTSRELPPRRHRRRLGGRRARRDAARRHHRRHRHPRPHAHDHGDHRRHRACGLRRPGADARRRRRRHHRRSRVPSPSRSLTITPISDVQGTTPTSPLVGDRVVVQGIVTSTYTTSDTLSGFFVQEEDADTDGDAATSEGVSVDCTGACPVGLTAGDLVEVTGIVLEDFAMTQIQATATGRVEVLSSGNALPTATEISLPAAGRTDAAATFESVEGMLTTFTDTLAVTESFELARFGQLELIAGGRPYQFTHDALPSVTGYTAYLAEQATRRIILDDDNDDQNDAVTGRADEDYPYPSPGLSTTNRFRGGDTIVDLTGALEWSFGAWRLRPVPGVDYTFESANPVPAPPDDLGGDLRVGTFNVLNYFATIDTTSSNDVGPCGPSGTLDCRGADSAAELAQQRAKIVAALAALDADVVGLVELQNDSGAGRDRPRQRPQRPAGCRSVHVRRHRHDRRRRHPSGASSTGRRPSPRSARTRCSTPRSIPRFIDTRNRPALIQTFAETATGERFTAAINHFKSKGSACTSTNPAVYDPDLGDGQGNCSVTRTQAAQALADYLATDPTGSGDPDVVILGDLNSYRREVPITTLVGAGYTDLVEELDR